MYDTLQNQARDARIARRTQLLQELEAQAIAMDKLDVDYSFVRDRYMAIHEELKELVESKKLIEDQHTRPNRLFSVARRAAAQAR
jgi:hypothetical protein